jgi:hypothetical protein
MQRTSSTSEVLPSPGNNASNFPSQHNAAGLLFNFALFSLTIFWGAFLLFQVQPIIGKFILPWFGGSPGVWTTCMLVFQLLLFGGYAYAHGLNLWLSVRSQALLHIVLLLISLVTLPITPESSWKPSASDAPTWLIASMLLCKVGVPYFLLSATGPLLQSWLSSTQLIDKPYRLYSLSNAGSVLALLSFPFFFEPTLSSPQQSMLWTWSYVVYALLCAWAAWTIYATRHAITPTENEVGIPRAVVSWDRWFSWLACSAIASTMLLATTNQVCQDTAVIPFLWVVPLAIYLLSFIITFDSERWYSRRPCIQFAAFSLLLIYGARLFEWRLPLPMEISLYFIGLFFVCMVCHGELVASRPHPSRLTLFYLSISAGGAFGGIFVGILAPYLFSGYYEFQWTILCAVMLFVVTYLRSYEAWHHRVPAGCKLSLALLIPSLAIVWLSYWNGHASQQLIATRNFYGVLSILDEGKGSAFGGLRKLVHGRVVHGTQFLDDSKQHFPTTYYTHSSGVGRVLQSLVDQPLHVGIVGLGAGTLAAYGRDRDRYRFYEINPQVVELASKYFTYIAESNAAVDVVLGDARLVLEQESPQQFDLLILDAFSGDAIPVHLLTAEAMDTYRRHLASNGKIAIHISNLYFDLQSVIQGLAESSRLECRFIEGREGECPDAYDSTWAILSSDTAWLETIARFSKASKPTGKAVLWTDERSNLFQVLK